MMKMKMMRVMRAGCIFVLLFGIAHATSYLIDTSAWNNAESIEAPPQNLNEIPLEWNADVKEKGYRKIWDIENLRDFIICGYYIHSASAPDFLQRLAGEFTSNSIYGIETFLLGTWANENYSRIDYLYYQHIPGYIIKGLPGCENKEECASSHPLGQFIIDEEHLKRYGVEEIYCGKEESAGC